MDINNEDDVYVVEDDTLTSGVSVYMGKASINHGRSVLVDNKNLHFTTDNQLTHGNGRVYPANKKYAEAIQLLYNVEVPIPQVSRNKAVSTLLFDENIKDFNGIVCAFNYSTPVTNIKKVDGITVIMSYDKCLGVYLGISGERFKHVAPVSTDMQLVTVNKFTLDS